MLSAAGGWVGIDDWGSDGVELYRLRVRSERLLVVSSGSRAWLVMLPAGPQTFNGNNLQAFQLIVVACRATNLA